MNTQNLHCTRCGEPIPPKTKYLAFFKDQPNGGLRIEVGCSHYTPPDLDKANAIAGGMYCGFRLLSTWLANIRCEPPKEFVEEHKTKAEDTPA